MDKQLSLSFFKDELKEINTRKKEFLSRIEAIVPWDEFIAIVEPFYYKGVRGNKPYELELMLRIHLLQNLYDLSDDGTRNEVIDSRAFSDFCNVSSENQIPDGETIRRFRNILIENNIHKRFFEFVVQSLQAKGLILKKGTIVDSTIIPASSSTKNKDKKRDADAHSTKKGNNWYFGYKAHAGADKDTGIVHKIVVTAANVHDITVLPELLSGEEESVYADSGYLGAQKREDAILKNVNGDKIKYQINRRPSQSKNNSNRSRAQIKRREHEKSSVRVKIEHVFAVIKNQLRFKKTRYKGLEKQTAKLNMMFALANLLIAERPSLHCT